MQWPVLRSIESIAWGGKTYLYYFWSLHDAKPVPSPLAQNPGDATDGFRMANCFCCLSQDVIVCLAHCRQELQQKSWKTARPFLQTETKTKTKCSRPRPRLHDPRPRRRLSFLSFRRVETKTLLTRTTSLQNAQTRLLFNSALFVKTGSYSQSIIINANTKKY